MTTILGLSGSLRRASLNTALLHTAAERAPAGVEVHLLRLDEVPMYDGDLERAGDPAAVVQLRDAVADSDALLLSFPEYNWSVPAVMKNAIDWLSRGGTGSVLHHKPTAMMSAAGGSGGRRAQAHMIDILAHNQVAVLDTALQVPRARQHVIEGRLATPDLVAELDGLLMELAAVAAGVTAGR